jgi:hypothetical protein
MIIKAKLCLKDFVAFCMESDVGLTGRLALLKFHEICKTFEINGESSEIQDIIGKTEKGVPYFSFFSSVCEIMERNNDEGQGENHPQIEEKKSNSASTFQHDELNKSTLIKFFLNEIPFKSPGNQVNKIDQILQQWRGNYNLLEHHHGYIQWLFPNSGTGKNPHAPTATDEDIVFIQQSSDIQNRFLSGFDLMLDFYGFQRIENKFSFNSQWKSRVKNLHDHPHNFLRITRILRSLSLFGFAKFQLPFLQLLLKLVYFKEKSLANADKTSVVY